MEEAYLKTGYLNSDFKIFHLIDAERKEFNFHYHDFYKVLIFINGNVSYIVEGKQYDLKPYDIVLVNAGEIHKPVIHDKTPYERIIVYISPEFFENYKKQDYDLFMCFQKAMDYHVNLIHFEDITKTKLYSACLELAESLHSSEYASSLLQKLKFIEWLVLLNQAILNENIHFAKAISANPTILTIMDYINGHIIENLTIDAISEKMYLNRSYIMHVFKEETGYTIGKYITEKRLFIAKRYIQNGASVTEACFQSGFKNYSAFYRAFKRKYKFLPKDSVDTL